MMKWGRKKHVSWFSKLSGSSELKPAKEKKQEDEASQKMSAKSSLNSTKLGNDRSKRLQRVSVDKEKAETRSADMEANGRFEEIMSSMRKKARKFQRETRGFLDVEAKDRDKGTVIMTPRIQVNREKQRWERRDQKLLQQKAKRSEQETDAKMKKLATRSYSRKDFVKLKETKLREVMLKADQRRKSMHLGTKENNKVRVFSPRACRVKAIEDLKKAKLRADGGGMENENFAVVKCSSDARKDFRDSMVEMIMENGINHPKELKELLVCYLTLNTDEYHDMIINVFHQVQSDLSLR